VFLGVRNIRDRKQLARLFTPQVRVAPEPLRRIVREGFFVGATNPKGLIVFTAVIPQFVDRSQGHITLQIATLGAICVAIGFLSDTVWALASGTAREWLGRSSQRLQWMTAGGGVTLIALGFGLALTGRRSWTGSREREDRLKRSAGILLHRGRGDGLEVLLVHPGGPAWSKRDAGAWSIPKGEYADDEDPFAAARREFEEELGTPPPAPPDAGAADLGEIRQRSGKRVRAWALAGDLDASGIVSNTVPFEWPPRSGRIIEIPEVDRAEWFGLGAAREKINVGQAPLLDRLEELLAGNTG
jgi:predicted NUDIX family NTP pyrophosphohydrolase